MITFVIQYGQMENTCVYWDILALLKNDLKTAFDVYAILIWIITDFSELFTKFEEKHKQILSFLSSYTVFKTIDHPVLFVMLSLS